MTVLADATGQPASYASIERHRGLEEKDYVKELVTHIVGHRSIGSEFGIHCQSG
jgi:hypothetical protein